MDTYDFAIIGAGSAGSFCAHQLRTLNQNCIIIDKSRGVGGRSARRRLDSLGSVDMGAMLIHHDDLGNAADSVEQVLDEALSNGILTEWKPISAAFGGERTAKIEGLVGRPSLNALHRYLIGTTPIIANTRCGNLSQSSDGLWQILDIDQQLIAKARAVIVNVPAAQMLPLCVWPKTWQARAEEAARNTISQWCTIVKAPKTSSIDVFYGGDELLASACYEASKQGSDCSDDVWVLHASAAWTRTCLEWSREDVGHTMAGRFAELSGLDTSPEILHVHRWLLSRFISDGALSLDTEQCFWDDDRKVGVCADWLGATDSSARGSSVIDAFNSAAQLLHKLQL